MWGPIGQPRRQLRSPRPQPRPTREQPLRGRRGGGQQNGVRGRDSSEGAGGPPVAPQHTPMGPRNADRPGRVRGHPQLRKPPPHSSPTPSAARASTLTAAPALPLSPRLPPVPARLQAVPELRSLAPHPVPTPRTRPPSALTPPPEDRQARAPCSAGGSRVGEGRASEGGAGRPLAVCARRRGVGPRAMPGVAGGGAGHWSLTTSSPSPLSARSSRLLASL